MNLTYSAIVLFICASSIVVGQKIILPDEYESIGQQKRNNSQPSSTTYGQHNNEHYKSNNQYANAVEAIYGIGVRLQILLGRSESTYRNFIVSPISVAVAVGQLMLGSTGKTRDYLAEAFITRPNEEPNTGMAQNNPHNIPFLKAHQELGNLVKALNMESKNNIYNLKTASALFLQPNIRLNQPFKESLENIYNATITPTDFHFNPREAQKIVNDWADKNTGGRIKTILPQPAPRTSVAILANSIYFKADWETPFSNEISKEGPFNITPDKQINVTYLRGQQDIRYIKSNSLNCSMIELPYVGNKINMYLILPDEDNGKEYDIAKFSMKLKSQDVINLINESKTRSVVVVIPKMSLSSTLSILDPLKQYKRYKELIMPSISLRMSEPTNTNTLDEKIETYKNNSFNNRFNTAVTESNDIFSLDGASPDKNFQINDIVQQISLAINEKGTEAAAITADIINYSGHVIKFRAIRPFLFFIRHRETGANLFWGTIVNPVE